MPTADPPIGLRESLEHARALLAHADSRLTERVYRRKPERVKPLR